MRNSGSPKKTDLKLKNNINGVVTMNVNKTDVHCGGSHSHHGHHSHSHYDVYGHEIGGLSVSPRGLVHGGLGKSQHMRYNYNVRRFHEFVVPSK